MEYELTDDEQLAIGRAMLSAALDAYGEFPATLDEEDPIKIARLVVRATVAASKVRTAEQKRLSEQKGGPVYSHTEPSEVVATAFWVWSEKPDVPLEEVAPCSVMGSRYLALAQGLAAMRSVSDGLSVLLDEEPFVYCDSGAFLLAKQGEDD